MTFAVMSVSPAGDAAWISQDSALWSEEGERVSSSCQKARSVPGRFIFGHSGDCLMGHQIALAAWRSADVDSLAENLERDFAAWQSSEPCFVAWAGWSPSLGRFVGYFTSHECAMVAETVLRGHVVHPELDAVWTTAYIDARIIEAHEQMARHAMAKQKFIGGVLHTARIDRNGISIRDIVDLDRPPPIRRQTHEGDGTAA